MADYEKVNTALIELGFFPNVNPISIDDEYPESITSEIPISPKAEVFFTYRESFEDPYGNLIPEEFQYQLDIPDEFNDSIFFNGDKFVVLTDRTAPNDAGYLKEKSFISVLHQKILNKINNSIAG